LQAFDLPRIFDPFYTTKQKGSGLGLTTSFSIVQKHGGVIQVESETGEGTVFRIFLPAASTVPAAQVKKEHEPAEGKGKVLIVDDEEYILNASAFILQRLGYEPVTALDGREAVTQYRQAFDRGEPFDLVIMDLTIPGGMGGKEAVQEILRADPEARVVVASGYSNDPVMSDYRRYGFCGVMVKPFRAEDLAEVVHETINGGINPSVEQA
jgi:two-component system cell cycle sensor histidine kinase/response regulator CckA